MTEMNLNENNNITDESIINTDAGKIVTPDEIILKVEHVSKTFGTGEATNHVLTDVSLEIKKGELMDDNMVSSCIDELLKL